MSCQLSPWRRDCAHSVYTIKHISRHIGNGWGEQNHPTVELHSYCCLIPTGESAISITMWYMLLVSKAHFKMRLKINPWEIKGIKNNFNDLSKDLAFFCVIHLSFFKLGQIPGFVLQFFVWFGRWFWFASFFFFLNFLKSGENCLQNLLLFAEVFYLESTLKVMISRLPGTINQGQSRTKTPTSQPFLIKNFICTSAFSFPAQITHCPAESSSSTAHYQAPTRIYP